MENIEPKSDPKASCWVSHNRKWGWKNEGIGVLIGIYLGYQYVIRYIWCNGWVFEVILLMLLSELLL